MSKPALTLIGILTLALLCMAIAILSTLTVYIVALILVWALSKTGGLTAMMLASFVFLFAATIIKVANKEDK